MHIRIFHRISIYRAGLCKLCTDRKFSLLKRYIAFFTRIFALLCLILPILRYPAAALEAAKQAYLLWGSAVLPALFPLGVLLSTFFALGGTDAPAKLLHPLCTRLFGLEGRAAALFAASAFAGYPMGARLTTDLCQKGCLPADRARLLLGCISTSGPGFITGTLCIGMFHDASLAPYLLVPHYASAAVLCLLTGRCAAVPPAPHVSIPALQRSLGATLAESVSSCLQSLLTVCGYMMLYSVICALCRQVLAPLPQGLRTFAQLLSGLLELTAGCTATASLPMHLRLPLCSLYLGFGGLCIHSQTHTIAAAAGLRPSCFWIHKSIQGVLAMVLCALMLYLFPLDAFDIGLPLPALLGILAGILLTAYVIERCLAAAQISS